MLSLFQLQLERLPERESKMLIILITKDEELLLRQEMISAGLITLRWLLHNKRVRRSQLLLSQQKLLKVTLPNLLLKVMPPNQKQKVMPSLLPKEKPKKNQQKMPSKKMRLLKKRKKLLKKLKLTRKSKRKETRSKKKKKRPTTPLPSLQIKRLRRLQDLPEKKHSKLSLTKSLLKQTT